MSETREEVGSDGRPTSRPHQAEQTSLIINIYVFCLFVYDFMFVCLFVCFDQIRQMWQSLVRPGFRT